MLAEADVQVDGGRPHDPVIRNPRFYWRIMALGTLGVGEAYMDGDWECEALDELAARVLRAGERARVPPRWPNVFSTLAMRFANMQTPAQAGPNARAHYDIGDDLYLAMLGPERVYSCAYWRDSSDLREAQEAKLDLVCRKLQLRAGHSLLDVGCGWGELARFAAQRYGARVVGVTVSPAQVTIARDRCAGLPVEIRLQDYRDVDERFDRVVSIGMFEHVGPRNYVDYFASMRRRLAHDGLFLLQSIGALRSQHAIDPWVAKYIFPNSVLPSAAQIARAIEGRWVIEDWHSFGPDYDRTLLAWAANFEAAWPSLRHRYDERFHRMWRYYLLTSAGAFRARHNQLWQIVLSPDGVPGGYVPDRYGGHNRR